MKRNIEIYSERCTKCYECVENCPGDVFEIIDEYPVPIQSDQCHGCHTCEDVCEFDAITVIDTSL